jgi:hypothetical protein
MTSAVAHAATAPCGPAWTETQLPGPSPTLWDRGFHYSSISAVSPTDIWAVGNANRFATPGDPRIGEAITAHWDGSKWTLVEPPHPPDETQFDQLSDVSALPGGLVWAVGDSDAFSTNGGVIIDHRSPSGWTVGTGADLSVGSGFAQYRAVDALSDSNVWVSATTWDNRHFFQHWNGSTWRSFSATGETSDPNTVSEINAIRAVSASNIWAVGEAFTPGVGASTLIEHWNGTRWSVAPTPASSGFQTLSNLYIASAADITAVGSDHFAFTPIVLHYDGVSWQAKAPPAAPTGMEGSSLAGTGSTDLWMLGAAGSGFGYEAHYDGTAWTQIAPPAIAGQTIDTGGFEGATQVNGQLWATGSGARTTASRLCPEKVTDAGFSAASVSVPLGETPDFVFPSSNMTAHRVVDDSPLHLFAGSPVAAGFSQTPYRFAFAGTYPLGDPTTGQTMTVRVAPLRSAASVTHGQKVQIVWSAVAAPSGRIFDVQVKSPGATTFTAWKTGVSARSAQFTTTTTGTYQFRTRIRSTGGVAVAWSPVISVTAT